MLNMEIPVQVAVRLRPSDDPNQCFFTNPTAQVVLSQSGQSYQVNQALPINCSQDVVYSAVIRTQLSCFLEGCDTSLILLGQSNTGKTYTLFGQGKDFCILGAESINKDSEQGVIPRFLRDIFNRLSQFPERSFILHITWMQVVQETIIDLLGSGLVKCNSLAEAFQYFQMGWKAMTTKPCHTIFTVSIEQKWVDTSGILYHRLSTASFCELAAYPEAGLTAFESVVKALIAPTDDTPVNYEQSLLTAMLRDSLGGRAYTWLICCISTAPQDASDTLRNLNLSWCCQGIKNFVTVNSFADNNTPIQPEKSLQQIPEQVLSLQFAAEQWIKLVNNAESLFHKILNAKVLSEADRSQVSEWLMLKAECNDCLKDEAIRNDARKQGLARIAEDTEPSEPSESDEESDASVNQDDSAFRDKLDKYMEYFREKTDELVSDKNDEYLKQKCKVSNDSDKHKIRESRFVNKEKKNNALKHVSSRISHLDDILKEKSSDLKKSELSTEKELMLRKEINNLRKTRECLHEERCNLGNKRKIYKSLSDSEERKLLECEEAIEAIDTAIEYKNAMICGRSPSEMSGTSGGKDSKSSHSSKGDLMLMARLDKLNHDEMKTLLYKYFQKVVDLRGACSALEAVVATAVTVERTTCPCLQLQTERLEHARRNANIATRHYHQLQRVAGESTAIKSSTNFKALMATQDNSGDEAVRMTERMRQLVKYHRETTIPSQNLKQLMPATTTPVAKVTRLKNKLVIVQEDKPHY